MTHPRYKLNYGFNHGALIHKSSLVIDDIEKLAETATPENGLHGVLNIFLLTDDKKLAQDAKDKLTAIANSLYGENPLDVRREAFLEAVDINIVCVEDQSLWDLEQWCLKKHLEPTEDPLF